VDGIFTNHAMNDTIYTEATESKMNMTTNNQPLDIIRETEHE